MQADPLITSDTLAKALAVTTRVGGTLVLISSHGLWFVSPLKMHF